MCPHKTATCKAVWPMAFPYEGGTFNNVIKSRHNWGSFFWAPRNSESQSWGRGTIRNVLLSKSISILLALGLLLLLWFALLLLLLLFLLSPLLSSLSLSLSLDDCARKGRDVIEVRTNNEGNGSITLFCLNCPYGYMLWVCITTSIRVFNMRLLTGTSPIFEVLASILQD